MKRLIGFWICTVLVAFAMISGGLADIVQPAPVMEGMRHLGYPDYFATILGIWKTLGGIVILIPRFALVKEWAYAGMMFDLTGASWSHYHSGDELWHVLVPLGIALVVVGSWALRPAGWKLGSGKS